MDCPKYECGKPCHMDCPKHECDKPCHKEKECLRSECESSSESCQNFCK